MNTSKFTKIFYIDNIQEHYADEYSEPFSYVFPWEGYVSKNTGEKFEFFLEVCPKTPNPDFVAVYLNFATSSNQAPRIEPDSIGIKFEISVLNYKGDKCLTKMFRKKLSNDKLVTFEISNTKEKRKVRYLNRKYLLDPQNGLLNGNKLFLDCEVEFNETVVSENKQQPHPNLNANVSKELTTESIKDFAKSSQNTSNVNDVAFEFRDNKKLNGNKALLASKSRVFKDIFDRQSWHKLIKLDERYELFFEVFNFIYNGTVASTEPMIYVELYYAAIKYQIDELKSYCEDWFCLRITDTTVCRLLILGDDMKSNKLKSAALNYIAKHKELVQQGNFQDQFKDRAKLLSEIHSRLLQ